MAEKISIRFFDDREVRAVWDETNSKWWFSALDIVGVLNVQDDYTKNRNYWKYLKTKLKNEQDEVVSATNQLKPIFFCSFLLVFSYLCTQSFRAKRQPQKPRYERKLQDVDIQHHEHSTIFENEIK